MNAPSPLPGASISTLPIRLRAYAEPPAQGAGGDRKLPEPSKWVLIFDTETTTDEGQALRFGTYQLRLGERLEEAGVFYRPEVLKPCELELLRSYAEQHGLALRSQAEFVEHVFFRKAYRFCATIVGFNLPFDISRVAIDHGLARRDMRGGFTFTLSPKKWWPQLRVRYISSRIHFINFAAPATLRNGRADRKRGRRSPVRRGFFVDIGTLANSLLSRSFTLGSLADHLGTKTRKASAEEHGGPLTPEYVDYAVQDTQVTWECFRSLRLQHGDLRLAKPLHQIYSEASIGKAYLEHMGIKPWREVQPDVPPDLIGIIMSTFYGGRAEVRVRHTVRQVVLCDFLSMYPTVCTLMRLWRFVIGHGMSWHDSSEETRLLLDSASLDVLRQPDIWKSLNTLVQIEPEADILPVRAEYPGSQSATIGSNYLECRPVWFTLADCIASKILTGRAPKVLRALTFAPGEPQTRLRPVAINGDQRLRVDPARRDFYQELIRLRQAIKGERDKAVGSEKGRLDVAQNALKIAANATAFGIFAEIIVDQPTRKLPKVTVHTGVGAPFEMKVRNVERPGRFFHPLLATLITGAARLMLAITERLVEENGLHWAFCDTDSMAIARPPEMDETEFYARVDVVVEWFSALNPYGFSGSVLQVEKVNSSLDGSGARVALHCLAISAKRYALFNVGPDGAPVLRKASAHGLGHLRSPYSENDPAPDLPPPRADRKDLGVDRWQHDLWWTIVNDVLHGQLGSSQLTYHPKLQLPAVSRYAATTPSIHRWFSKHNRNLLYDRQVRPFGFLNAFTAADGRPVVAPFDKDLARSAGRAFDRQAGEAVGAADLKTYAEMLAGYHLSPEAKFENGRPFDRGVTRRRYVRANGFKHIGKEANRWEEQFFLGLDPEAEIAYGTAPDGLTATVEELRRAKALVGERRLADAIGVSRGTLGRVLKADAPVGITVLGAITRSLPEFWIEQRRAEQEADQVLAWLTDEIAREGLGKVARRLGLDAANLAAVRAGRRKCSSELIKAIKAIALQTPARHTFHRQR